MTPDPDCRVCLGPCDREIHAATVRVHRWLRERLKPRPIASVQPKTPNTRAVSPMAGTLRYPRVTRGN